MKKFIKTVCVILILIISACGIFGCTGVTTPAEDKEYPITLSREYNGKNVLTIESEISRYIKNVDNTDYLASVLHERQTKYLNEESLDNYDYQKINISWENTGKSETYTVHVADNDKFENEFTYTTKSTSVSKEVGIFIPGKIYYYKVVGSESGESKVDSFVANSTVRYISADKVINMRDLGGWKTKDGKTLNYGKIYRGAALNETNASYLSSEAKRIFDYLGIKGEIDLRGENLGDTETGEIYKNKINSDYPILRKDIVYFAYTDMTAHEDRAKNNLPKIFEFLANEDNYPVYFHCSVGADRTGTLGFILETLLGVEYKYAMLDFELTSFTNTYTAGGTRRRSTTEADKEGAHFKTPSDDDATFASLGFAYELLMAKYKSYSTDPQAVMEKYLRDMGVTKSQIDKVKEIMLG